MHYKCALALYQEVVDHFQGRVDFVQCGAAEHWHPALKGVLNLVGQTSLRDFLRTIYHSQGVLCPVTFAMHAAAALVTAPGQPKHRPCVVVAGGREPPQWEAYPQHRFLHTVGALSCCQSGGCWKSRCQTVGDNDQKDFRNLCEQPVEIADQLVIPQCMQMIRSQEVIMAIEKYYEGGVLRYPGSRSCSQTPRHQPVNHADSHRKILLEFRHGLGDAVQLTSVLTHLRHFHPQWEINVSALTGKHSCFFRQADSVYRLDHSPKSNFQDQERFVLDWHECHNDHEHWPSTKVARCLLEIFQITPRQEWMHYTIAYGEAEKQAAREYLQEVSGAMPNNGARFPTVIIHYQGNTSQSKKDLPHDLIRALCSDFIEHGYIPVILDWDKRCPFIDNTSIFNPDSSHPLWSQTKTGDAAIIAAMIEASSLMIGIDSGPLHVAGATTTPTIGVWHHHHPVKYYDLADNVIHMVPTDHARKTNGLASTKYFESTYRYHVYEDMALETRSLALSLLTQQTEVDVRRSLLDKQLHRGLTSHKYDMSYYQEHRDAGLDYLAYGQWQQDYTAWLTDVFRLQNKELLDVGCGCGSIVHGFYEAQVNSRGSDVNEDMIVLGREQWPEHTKSLHICDAVNLHLFEDSAFDFLHCSQVAEHWKPELVPFILRELGRITKPGGLCICILDTEEYFLRSGRNPEEDDPTHICIKSINWWFQAWSLAGWEVCSSEYERSLKSHPRTFLSQYDWDWLVLRRKRSE